MLERGKLDRGVVEIVDTESLVPAEHLLRKIDAAVDFNRVYEMVEALYSEDNGRPSVDPVVLFKQDGTDPASVRTAVSAADGGRSQRKHLLPLVSGLYPPVGNTALFHGEL